MATTTYKDYMNFIGAYKKPRSEEDLIKIPEKVIEDRKIVKSEIFIKINNPEEKKQVRSKISTLSRNFEVKKFDEGKTNGTRERTDIKKSSVETNKLSEHKTNTTWKRTDTKECSAKNSEEKFPVSIKEITEKLSTAQTFNNKVKINNPKSAGNITKRTEIDENTKHKIGNTVMREWLTSYNNKATTIMQNDGYQTNKISRIHNVIETLSSQGALDKLSGRSNPEADKI